MNEHQKQVNPCSLETDPFATLHFSALWYPPSISIIPRARSTQERRISEAYSANMPVRQ